MELRDSPIGKILMTGTTKENDIQQKILYARKKFVTRECERRGWPLEVTELSITQILEINDMEEWKNPKIKGEKK